MDRGRGDRALSRPSLRALLETIAEVEPLAATLDRWEGLDRAAAVEMLREVAASLPRDPPRRPTPRPASRRAKDDCLHIWTDGASRGNPGPAAIGALLCASDGRPVDSLSEAIGRRTNNYAEYEAVVRALARAAELGAREVRLFADSELVVKQLAGTYRVKNAELRAQYEAVKALERRFAGGVRFQHVRREQNRDADALANQALDRG